MWPAIPEDELQQAEWLVVIGRRHIARQREFIEEMRASGLNTNLAERLLALLISTQRDNELRRDRLLANDPMPT